MAAALFEKYIKTEKWEEDYFCATDEIKRISDYSGLNFKEVIDLPYSFYLLLRRETWIKSWEATEEGKDFLQTLWRIRQTEADSDGVEKFKKGGKKQ